MNKLLTGALAVGGLMMYTACSDTFDPSSDREGRILPVVEVNKTVAAPKSEAAAKSKATGQAMEISADDLRLRLTADDGSFSREWAGVSAFDNSADFSVGTYKFEAYYGTEGEEGFEKPYYYGAASLRVLENQTTPVNVTASLGNAMVSVVYTDNVREFFRTIEGEVVSVGGTHAYATTETRPVYINAGHVEVNVNVTKQSGAQAKLNVTSFEAAPRNHYRVTVDVNGGTGMLDIKFESELAEETVELDISDAAFSAPAPTLTASGFESGTPLTFVANTVPSEKLRVIATGQTILKTAVLTTRSASLRAQGWPETVDFASADAATLQLLTNLGLEYPGLSGVMSKMAVVDFTNVIKKIAYIDGGDNTTEFSLVVKDAYSKVSEEMKLALNIEKLELTVANVESIMQDETHLLIDVDYNGADPANDITVQLRNSRGTYDATTIESVTPLSRAGQRYRLTVSVPADMNPIVFRLVCGSLEPVEQTVRRAGAPIAISDNDVFATHAKFTVTGADAATNAAAAKVYISTNGTDFTEVTPSAVEDAAISLASLSPATHYYVKIFANEGYSRTVEFTTEAAAQFPNSGMENWYSENAYGKKTMWVGKTDIKCWYPNSSGENFWATRNPRTTGQTNGTTCYYTSFSGTVAVSGNNGNAAEISTLGVGEGVTYVHTKSGVEGDVKYRVPGMLFVGDITPDGQAGETITYGKAFTSRPESMSFMYKFDPSKNNESFKVLLVIENRDNGKVTEIARGEFESNEAKSAFTPCKVNLTYSNAKMKATHAYAVFLSSTAESPKVYSLQGSDDVFNGYGDSKYVGAVLTVDDIVLNY